MLGVPRTPAATARVGVRWIRWTAYPHGDGRTDRWHVEQPGRTRCGRRFYAHDRVERMSETPPPRVRCRSCYALTRRDGIA